MNQAGQGERDEGRADRSSASFRDPAASSRDDYDSARFLRSRAARADASRRQPSLSDSSISSLSPYRPSYLSPSQPLTGTQYRPSSAPPRTIRVGEDRYRPGARRTAAQPLKATWEPRPDEYEPGESEESTSEAKNEGRSRRRPNGPKLIRIAKSYGWRVYALPILIVITVLALVNTTTTTSPQNSSVQAAGEGAVAVEGTAKPVNLNIPTAELPKGGEFTLSGAGQWHVVPGQGPRVGTGEKLYTYTVEVENGIDPASYAGDDGFAQAVESTLSDPRSWTGSGKVSFQRVDASYPTPSFRVSLTTPDTVHRPDICGFQIRYEASCRRKTGPNDRVVINLARWVRGAMAFSGDLGGYRQYAINHEVGHALGNGHVGCAATGDPAPVMMQQSFGVSNDYVAQLNQVDPTNYGAVPADGKVCKPNSWPNP